jgi:two-component system, NtrC family, nitrogen regulation sensor histidine kinase GlnL
LNGLYQRTLESANFGILVFNRAGRLLYINPAAEEILQGSAQALSGRHFRTLFRGSRDAVRIIRKALGESAVVTGFDIKVLPHGRPAAGEEAAAPTSAIIGASPLFDAAGMNDGAVLSIKPAEILTMVGQEERAAGSAEGLQMLAYGIAHEIRNPLGGIRGAAQWLLRRETSEEERREGAGLILREAERINSLVEKMLEMSKPPPPPRPFSLLPLLREALELVAAEIRNQGKEIRCELDVDPSLPNVSGHADTIFRAILNIVKNAAEAIDSKGTVKVEARMNVDLRWSLAKGKKRSFVEIAVVDDGEGMSGESVRKALLPFYTTKPKGTGLGLVMARQAISRHGGKLEIQSVRGKGTAVKISLPAETRKT